MAKLFSIVALSFTVSYVLVTIITLFPFSLHANVGQPRKVNLSDQVIYKKMFDEIQNRVLVDKKVYPSNLTLDRIIEMWNLVKTIFNLALI